MDICYTQDFVHHKLDVAHGVELYLIEFYLFNIDIKYTQYKSCSIAKNNTILNESHQSGSCVSKKASMHRIMLKGNA